MSDDGWATPGVPVAQPAAAPAADARALTAALDQVLAVDPALLSAEVALERAETLLAAQDRLASAGLRAVGDADARDLWTLRSAGSTRTWLRTLPVGDRGQLAAWRALQDRRLVRSALDDGEVSLRTAVLLAKELARVPTHVDADQLEAVLVDGVGDVMRVWAGGACLEPTTEQEAEFGRRQEELAAAVRAGLRDPWTDAAGQLEPALVLLAKELAPAEVAAAVTLLVDALQPEPEAEALAEQAYRERGLTLTKRKGGGWSLRAHLTDETGQVLFDELAARRRARTAAPDASEGISAPATSADETACGTAGPGTPVEPFSQPQLDDPAVQGTPLLSAEQGRHDAFAQLLRDLAGTAPGSGAPRPVTLTITASLDALQGRPGAPPGRLRTAGGDVPLTPSQLRDHACRSLLSSVLVEAAGRPVGASGEHRNATPRERRVMRAAWGTRCGVNGCALPGLVPHHAEPFWKSRQTRQADLVPLCEHHHHDVHEGHHQLRLRDCRVLDEWGWVTATRTQEQRWAG